jgi:hypothetical protein
MDLGKGKAARASSGARWVLPMLVCGIFLALAVPAAAHIERASYWPFPEAENAGGQPAGGAIPTARDLPSALNKAAVGDTRVVCEGTVPKWPKKQIKKAKKKLKGKARKKKLKKLKKGYKKKVNANPSIKALEASIKDAQAHGYKLRSSQPALILTNQNAKELRRVNKQLLTLCAYHEIQPAVTASHNNDRVVIMPGLYTEPTSRKAPTHDPACANLVETNDHGTTGALSYKYQSKCPNDQNLIAVIGRATTDLTVPQPPALDRHGIPDAGVCIRCNLQMEGSGVKPDDVTIDGGDPALGDHGPGGENPPDYAKDVGVRADRADGFVIRNVKVRHFNEHGVYEMETDGFLLDRVKMAYNSEYGLLTFVADHSLVENCEAWGSGDSGLYPGAGADLGDAVDPDGTHPERRRYGTEMRNCDSHHNTGGYSGTDGNSVWVHHNNFYDNTLGFTTDVFTAPGHPGFPQDSDLVENNNFYDNNFNSYLPPCAPGQSPGPAQPGQSPAAPGGNCSDIDPTIPVPVGTGMWIAGGNHNIMRNNRFFDNWRRGTMLFAVPDALVCGPAGSVDESLLAGCNATGFSTSYNNQYYGNSMGVAPDGSKQPNGTDFWWDDFVGNTGNCWHDNNGVDGTPASVTSMPAAPLLPSNCVASIGLGVGNTLAEAELLGCFASFSQGVGDCPWFTTPPKP